MCGPCQGQGMIGESEGGEAWTGRAEMDVAGRWVKRWRRCTGCGEMKQGYRGDKKRSVYFTIVGGSRFHNLSLPTLYFTSQYRRGGSAPVPDCRISPSFQIENLRISTNKSVIVHMQISQTK